MQHWILLAIITGFVAAGGNIFKKYLLKNQLNPYSLVVMSSIIYFIFGIFLYLYIGSKHKNILDCGDVLFSNCKIKPINVILLVILISFLFMIGTIAMTNSIKITPNPGYTSSIASGISIITLMILSIIIFKSHFNIHTLIGIFLIISGVFIINKFSSKK